MKKAILLTVFYFFVKISVAQTILGIDVSHHQGNINWQLVANDGKVFAFCKATEGRTYQDPRFIANMTGGMNAGIVMGAYHFARPDNNTAIQDADNFLATASNYIGGGFLPPVLDLEDPNSSTHLDQLFTSSQLTAWVQAWLDRVENQTGVKPILYLSSHYAYYLSTSLTSYGLWIAKPGTSPTTPPNNTGNWNDWLFKQYSWNGSVNGISGNVDLDVFHGTNSDFNALVSVQEYNNPEFSFYPNPVYNYLYIKSKSTSHPVSVKIFDLNGRLLKRLDGEIAKIDTGGLSNGIYLLQVVFDNGKRATARFVKL